MIIALLVLAGFFTAFLSGIFGIGGGLLFLILLSWILPIEEAIYVHAGTQLLSNGIRFWIHRSQLDKAEIRKFGWGFAIGSLPAAWIFLQLDLSGLKVFIYIYGAFFMSIPKPILKTLFAKLPSLTIPILTPLDGMIFGAVGPFLAPYFYARDMPPPTFIATEGLIAAATHLIRLAVYIGLGTVLLKGEGAMDPKIAMIPLILIPTTYLGTTLAKNIVYKFEPARFYQWIRIIIVMMCILSLARHFILPGQN